MRQQTVALISMQTPEGKQRPKFKPMPRPSSAFQRALQAVRHTKRMSVHDKLVRKLLGDRAKDE